MGIIGTIKPKESWKDEVKIYSSRLDQLLCLDAKYQETIKELWPDKVWPTTKVEGRQLVAFQIAVFVTNIFSLSCNATALVVELWLKGRFFSVPLNTRFVYESWGAIHYANELLEKADIEEARRLANSLLVGTYKARVQLPQRQHGRQYAIEKSPNTMDYIRSLQNIDPSAVEIYNFLSSASHPNTLQNSYFANMGPPISGWENSLFKSHAHELLDMVLRAHECSSAAMQAEVVSILQKSAQILSS